MEDQSIFLACITTTISSKEYLTRNESFLPSFAILARILLYQLLNVVSLPTTVPSPDVTLERSKDGVKLFAGDSETFICQVAKHSDIDTAVNVSLVWVHELNGKSPEILQTENFILEGVEKVTQKMHIVKNLNSLYENIVCKCILHPVDGSYILSSEESSQSINTDVQG